MFARTVGYTEVKAQETALAALCLALDPDAIPLPEVPAVHASLCRMAKLVAGAATLLARRLEESNVWHQQGDKSAADYLSRLAGVSKGAAIDALTTSKRLVHLPGIEAAVRNGELSGEQTVAIADAATANPDAEQELLGKAGAQSLPELRDECRRVKADADADREATYARLRANRRLRRWTDGEGAYNLSLRTTADDGARIDAALQPVLDRLFHEARRAGRCEPVEAYGADALVALIANGSDDKPSRGRESKVIALVDYETLRRGHAEPGETCEIAGVGPVPASTVRAMMADSFLALLVTDGVDVYTVAHAGRQVTAHQRSALEARGYRCEVPGCGVRHNLEIDHVTGWHFTRTTKLDDLVWACGWHHYLKTHRGYQLLGPPRQRQWLGPDGQIVAAEHTPSEPTGPPPTGPPDQPGLFDHPGAA